MAREVHSKEIDEDQPVVGQERPAVEEPPAPDAEASRMKQKETPAGVPSAAAPTPPSGRLAASIQRMRPAGRWALSPRSGISQHLHGLGPRPGGYTVMIVGTGCGLRARRWRAMLPAAIAAAAGAFAESWVAVQLVPLNYWGEGLTEWDAVVLILEFTAMFGDHTVLLFAGRRGKHEQTPAVASSFHHKVMVNWIVALLSGDCRRVAHRAARQHDRPIKHAAYRRGLGTPRRHSFCHHACCDMRAGRMAAALSKGIRGDAARVCGRRAGGHINH